MARPIWSGTLSFGLLNIPVSLMPGERKVDLSFRMLDSRDRKPIRFERVNADTGEEVPWKDIIKAFEYDKGSYVVLEEADIKAAAPESHETVEVETFVDAAEIDRHLVVNVRATMLLVDAYAAGHDGARGGRIVLFSSGQRLGPMPGELAYAASKAAADLLGIQHHLAHGTAVVMVASRARLLSMTAAPYSAGTPATASRGSTTRWGRW